MLKKNKQKIIIRSMENKITAIEVSEEIIKKNIHCSWPKGHA